ncbi:MAG: tRNA modification GTPase [Planctomycetia bacterium]|nr:tRNA modification GTPase [Planctomycetia bacterium]
MIYDPQDTIAAIASAPGGAARGIIRVSGPRAVRCVEEAWQPDDGTSLGSLRRPTVANGRIKPPGLAAAIPCRLHVWPTARSYARQPSVEIHTVGSPPLLSALLRALCQAGARMAEPGEFTLRAFLAGRVDLTQAEAVLGVIDAGDSRELAVALDQLAGGLARPLDRLRDALVDLLAHLEAGLDFVEESIEFISRDELARQLSAAAAIVQELAARTATRGIATEAVRAVLVGKPNAGKSSLFNALLERTAAIVAATAGTTRDYLVGELVLGGVRIELVDTAGGEQQTGATGIAASAQQATANQRRKAAIELVCLDATRPLSDGELAEIAATDASPPRLVVLTKTDQPCADEAIAGAVATSSKTGAGLDELRARLRALATQARGDTGPCVAATAARCQGLLAAAAAALARAIEIVEAGLGEELVAAEVRFALDELGQVVGAVYTEDVLDRVFSRFCIGK